MPSASKPKNPTIQDLADQLAALRVDLADLTEMKGDVGKAKAHRAADTAHAKTTELRSEAERLAIRAGERVDEALGLVRQQPVQSLALAAALGFLAGLLTARR